MCLVIFIPFITSMDSVEVSWFAGPVFILPVVTGRIGNVFFKIEQFLLFIQIFLCFGSVKRFWSKIGTTCRFLAWNFNGSWLSSLRDEARCSDRPTLLELEKKISSSMQNTYDMKRTRLRRSSFSVIMSISRSSGGNAEMSSSVGLIERW